MLGAYPFWECCVVCLSSCFAAGAFISDGKVACACYVVCSSEIVRERKRLDFDDWARSCAFITIWASRTRSAVAIEKL